MSSHIIQFGKHRFVCGLFWQSLSRPRELVKEAAELARKIDCDLVVLRREYSTAQAGFLQSHGGGRQQLYSLAAAVAGKLARDGANYDGENQPVHNWLAAFRLPDGQWAYFAVRDANFLPNGDFSGSREAVFERLHGDYGLGGWNLVIGDAELESYGFHNFSEMRIEDLLGQSGAAPVKVQKAWLLRPAQTRLSPKTVAVAAACALTAVLALGFGNHWYRLHQARLREAADAELLRQVELRRGAVAALPRPWLGTPTPHSLTEACLEGFSQLTPGGWSLVDYRCAPTEVRYAWSRQESTVGFLLEQVPEALVDASGNSASYGRSLALPARRDETLRAARTVLPAIESRLQLMHLGLHLTVKARPAQAPGAVAPQWDTYLYVIDSIGMSPLEVAAILSAPGIRLDKLTYRAGLWSMEGVIYAN